MEIQSDRAALPKLTDDTAFAAGARPEGNDSVA